MKNPLSAQLQSLDHTRVIVTDRRAHLAGREIKVFAAVDVNNRRTAAADDEGRLPGPAVSDQVPSGPFEKVIPSNHHREYRTQLKGMSNWVGDY